MIVFVTVLASLAIGSILEGLLHQFILHSGQKRLLWGVLYGAFRAHSIEHHPAYRDDKYHQVPIQKENRLSLGWYTLPLVLILTSPLPYFAWLWFGIYAGLAVPLTFTAYYAAYETLHWNMHFPRADGRPRWFRRYRPLRAYFDWFDKRHFIHHLADDRNFNVVLPFYDLLTGRYTVSADHAPWAVRLRKRRNLRKAEAIRSARIGL